LGGLLEFQCLGSVETTRLELEKCGLSEQRYFFASLSSLEQLPELDWLQPTILNWFDPIRATSNLLLAQVCES
jgi:hypothetical protein